MEFTADKTERMDKFLAQASGLSRGTVQKLIKAGQVMVNGKAEKETDHPLSPNDSIEMAYEREGEMAGSGRPLKIVYENDEVLVIDKPAGLIVHPGANNKDDTLSHALLSYYPEIRNVGESFRPGIVHRLDEDTSGLLIVAKTPAAFDYYKKQFAERTIQKEYLALVHGIPEKLHDIINAPLEKNFRSRKMKVSAPGGVGKESVTEYNVVAQGGGLPANAAPQAGVDQMALLKVNLHTGRTHQIRAHLAHINHPIVGDPVYGGQYKEKDKEFLNRQFLHAHRLKFQLMDGTWIELTSELPDDLKLILKRFEITY